MKPSVRSVAWSAALLLMSMGSASASWNLSLVSEELVASLYYDLAAEGDVLYAAGKRGIDMFDLTDPAEPVFLGHFASQGIANGVAVEDGLLLVGDVYGFEAWDVSDPVDPMFLNRFDAWDTGIYPERLIVRDGLAYVATYAGMAVFDVSVPAEDLRLISHDPGQFYCYRLGLSGDLAVLADVFGLLIYDVSEPRVPTRIGEVSGLVFALELEVQGHLAYVPYIEGLEIYDLSDPTRPVLLGGGGETGLGSAEAVTVVGNTAYVAHGSYLDIFDVSDPTDPWQTSFMFTRAQPRGLLAHGEFLYMNADAAGIEVVDISEPRLPVSLRLVPPPGQGGRRSVDWLEDRLYLANGTQGVSIYGQVEPGELTLLGTINTPGSAERVDVQGDRLFVADRNTLEIWNVADPAAPYQLGSYRSTGQPYDVHLDGDRALLTDFYGLSVLDVSNPAAPVRLGTYYTSNEGTPYVALPNGRWILLGTGYGGLMVLDAQQPERMVRVGQVPQDNSRSYVDLRWIDTDLMAAARSTGGFDVIDVSQPSSPEIVGEYEAEDSTGGLDFQPPYMAIADGDTGVKILDLTDPTAPRLCGWSQTPGNARGVAWGPDGGLYVADDSSLLGLSFQPGPDEAAPQVEILEPAELGTPGGKTFEVRGRATDDASGVERVEVRLEGGEWLRAYGRETWAAFLEPGIREGSVYFEVRAVDRAGRTGPVESRRAYHRPAGPRVLVGGTMDSRVDGNPGRLRILSLVEDPFGSVHLGEETPQLYWDGLPTGVYLEPDEDLQPEGVELRVFSLDLDWPGAPPGTWTVGIGVDDRFGNPSALWPYLTVPQR